MTDVHLPPRAQTTGVDHPIAARDPTPDRAGVPGSSQEAPVKLRSTALAALSVALLSLPVQAQEPTSSVTFDDVGFTFDRTLGASVNVTSVPGEEPAPPELTAPDEPHLTFTLYGPKAEFAKVPRVGGAGSVVRFYRVADLTPYEAATRELELLQGILAGRPDAASLATAPDGLPYMPPMIDAAQVLRARVQYVDLPGLTGIAYITAFGQDFYPYTSDRFEYTFQGLSADGTTYVSATFLLQTDLFPENVTVEQADRILATQARLDAYQAGSRATLDGATPDAFSPSLDAATALIASIILGGVPVSEGAPATSPAPSASPAAG
jgi:hypothetical protein